MQLLQDDAQAHCGQRVCCFLQHRADSAVEVGLDARTGRSWVPIPSLKPFDAEYVTRDQFGAGSVRAWGGVSLVKWAPPLMV